MNNLTRILEEESLWRIKNVKTKTPGPEPYSELYQPSECGVSANLVPTSEDRGCHVVSVTDLYGRIFDFLNRSRYFIFQVAPQL
jgi:hypothetical protein